jgi:pimeloyl-ACP methyl ester carboxylesterase
MELTDSWGDRVVHATNADLHCYHTGSGPPVILAHGFYDSGRRWIPLGNDLADEYEVVAYDARGHGRSDAPETGYDLEDRIADLRAVVRDFEFEDPILVGHSMGAATVARTAATHPDLPRGVLLEDPVGVHDVPDAGPDERVQLARQKIEDASDQSVKELIAEHYQDLDPDHARRLATASRNVHPNAAEITRNGYPSPLGDVFPEIASPTLVLRRDAEIERRVADLDIASGLPDGRLVHVPDAGHYVFQDEYEAAYAELQTFLRRI